MVISCTIERNTIPFATAGISRTSTLTCRVSDFADDLAADLSVSRRGSVRQADRRRDSVGSLATAEVVRILRDTRRPTLTDINAKRGSMTKPKAKSPTKLTKSRPQPNASKGFGPKTGLFSSRSPPQPTYYPGQYSKSVIYPMQHWSQSRCTLEAQLQSSVPLLYPSRSFRTGLTKPPKGLNANMQM
jgi:hypothetical protein